MLKGSERSLQAEDPVQWEFLLPKPTRISFDSEAFNLPNTPTSRVEITEQAASIPKFGERRRNGSVPVSRDAISVAQDGIVFVSKGNYEGRKRPNNARRIAPRTGALSSNDTSATSDPTVQTFPPSFTLYTTFPADVVLYQPGDRGKRGRETCARSTCDVCTCVRSPALTYYGTLTAARRILGWLGKRIRKKPSSKRHGAISLRIIWRGPFQIECLSNKLPHWGEKYRQLK